jgi:hypothetical protein
VVRLAMVVMAHLLFEDAEQVVDGVLDPLENAMIVNVAERIDQVLDGLDGFALDRPVLALSGQRGTEQKDPQRQERPGEEPP